MLFKGLNGRLIFSGITVAVIVLISIAVLSFRSAREYQDVDARVEHTHAVINELNKVALSLEVAESAERGYLITGREDYKEQFETAGSAIPGLLRSLRTITSDNAVQQQRLDALDQFVTGRQRLLEEGIRLIQQGRTSLAADLVREGTGARLMGDVRLLVEAMAKEENRLLSERTAASAASFAQTKYVIMLGNSAALLLLVVTFYFLWREVAMRTKAQHIAEEYASEVEDLYNNAPCGYHSLDESGRIVRANDTELALLGYERHEIIGKSFKDILTPQSQQLFSGNLAYLRREGVIKEVEYDLVKKNGTVVPVALSATLVRDGQGDYVMSRSTLFDITALRARENEVNALNKELEQRAQQLSSTNKELEGFSYSVSHDLRIPLRAVDGYARMLEEDSAHKLDDEDRRKIEVIRDNARKMGDLINDLLAFSRLSRKPMETTRIDMEALVQDVFRTISQGDNKHGAELVVHTLAPAVGDFGLVRQAWANLLSNAVKFTSKSEQPLIEVESHTGEGVTIYCVSDNGVGFNMKYYEKLFGVFQRLHGPDEFPGSGVGLAIVQRVVTRHGGQVWAEGKPDKGAKFFFSMPKELGNV